MAMDNESILIELKARNVIAASDEPKILSYIKQMKSKSMAYCNLTELPDGLFYTLVEMVEQRMGVNQVSSITRGDTTIKYAVPTPDEIISNFQSELNKFKRMKMI